MESINESIARAIQSGRPSHAPAQPPMARDCMTTSVVTFREDQTVQEVIRTLLSKRISGGPVVNDDEQVVGMISEMDCLRAVAGGAYNNEPFENGRLVGEVMSKKCVTIEPEATLYTMVHLFDEQKIRRLPVVDGARLLGQVSRRDVLIALERSY
jgi:CBS domain-containing protein